MITTTTIPPATSANGFSAHHAHPLRIRNTAADFQESLNPNLTASRRTDSNTFLSLVNGADDPQRKRAAIDGFASGFASAQADDNTLKITPASANIAAASQTVNAGALPDSVAVMNSYANLADQIAASDLPASVKTNMLDDIATQMAKLYDQQKQSTSLADRLSQFKNATGAPAGTVSAALAADKPAFTTEDGSPVFSSDASQPQSLVWRDNDSGKANPEQMVAALNRMSHTPSTIRQMANQTASTGGRWRSSSDTMATVERALADKGIPAYSASDAQLPDYVLQQLDAAQSSGTGASGDSSGTSDQKDAIWTHEVKDGVGMIHLGDEYTLRIDEKDQSITLVNNLTHASTRIWGDPHMDIGNDGKNDVDFHDGMTLKLDNGLELRLGTMSNGGDVTYTTNLTILQGGRAIQVSGIAGDMDGKDNLRIVQSNEGEALAHLTPKGAFVLHEAGGTWETKDNQAISQDYVNEAEKIYHGDVHIMS